MSTTAIIDYAGEVIEASISQFRCYAPVLNYPPVFGSFVRIGKVSRHDPFETPMPEDGTLYGLVHQSSTCSQASNRRPSAFGLEGSDLEREQPQIFELLATEFSCLVVAHVHGGEIRSFLPPRPPTLHSRVYVAEQGEIGLLTTRFDYFRSALNLPDRSIADELVAATVRQASVTHADDSDYIVRAGKEISMLLRDDYDRLDSILRKIGPI
jgi:hypothetical protein